MQGNTVDDGSHGQLRDASVQERTLEIVGLECTTHLEEAIGFVAVGKIGR